MNIEVKERVLQINKGLVPQGYKRTKLGIIPENWSLKKLGSIARINKKQLSENTDSNYKFYYIDISCVEAGKIKYAAKPILFKNAPSRARRKVNINDIIMSTVRPNLKAFACVSDERKNLICSTGFSVLSEKKETSLSKYIFYNLFSYQSEKYYFACVVGSNYPALNNSDVKKLTIPIPPLKEQQKIAEVLSTCDKVIELKEKLIEQKKLQKKYLMQTLLNPDNPNFRRLAKFYGKWEEVKLGECFTERRENNCTLRLLSITSEKGVIDRMEIERKDNSNEDKSKYRVILKGDIGYNTMRMWQGVSGVSNLNGIISPAYTVCEPKEEVCPEFFGYLFKLQSAINVFHRYSQGLVNDTLSLKYTPFAKLNFSIPKYEEQKAIADVLSVVDQEIDLLEKELEQQKLKKKALMQLLLTGKVRVSVS